MLLGRLLLPEPTHRFGEKPMLLLYFVISIGLQLVFWLVPNIIAGATALSIMGFFQGPFFATVSARSGFRDGQDCIEQISNGIYAQGVSVASKIFPRKIQAAALSKMPLNPRSPSSYAKHQHGSPIQCQQASSLWLLRRALLFSLR